MTTNHKPSPLDELDQFRLRSLLVFIAFIAIVLGLGRAFFVWHSSLVSHDEANQIGGGMTKAEVIAILGEPHGRDYSGRYWSYQCDHPTWHSDPLSIHFDERGCVEFVSR